MMNINNKSHEQNVKIRHVLPRLNEEETATILGDKVPDVQKWPRSRFKRIESEHRPPNSSRIEKLLDILKKEQRLELSPDEKKLATFFVAENREYGVYGGAVLLKRKVLNKYKERKSRYGLQGESLWSCFLGLQFPQKDLLCMSGEKALFIDGFYTELYYVLRSFGEERNALILWVTLNSKEALLLDKLGNFPFVVQIKPEDAIDGLFHGILPLRKGLNASFLKEEQAKLPTHEDRLEDLLSSYSSFNFEASQEEEKR